MRFPDLAGAAVDRWAGSAGGWMSVAGALSLEVVVLQELAEVLVAVGDHDLAWATAKRS
jgi:hypothetical protein